MCVPTPTNLQVSPVMHGPSNTHAGMQGGPTEGAAALFLQASLSQGLSPSLVPSTTIFSPLAYQWHARGAPQRNLRFQSGLTAQGLNFL